MSSTPATSDRLSRASSSSSGPPDQGSAGTPELFVYGTLTLNAVVFTLLDRVPQSVLTEAAGWRVACLPALPYPGLVRDEGSTAAGRVYADLTLAEWSVLDAFEDPTYVIEPLQLENGHRGLAYVWPGDALPETWTTELLDHAALAAYLERCASWRTRHEAASLPTRDDPR